jgi:hypothetical protein
LLFNFKLVHVLGTQHQGPDVLSIKEQLPENFLSDTPEDAEEWLETKALYVSAQEISGLYIQPSRTEALLSCNLTPVQSTYERLQDIQKFLENMTLPQMESEQQKKQFLKQALQCFTKEGSLFRKRSEGLLAKVIFDENIKLRIMIEAHDGLGHRGIEAVFQTIKKRFYWPGLYQDVQHYVQTCYECQIRSTMKVEVPLAIYILITIFTHIYVDIMLMPIAQGYRYIVAARDGLTQAAEGRALKRADTASLKQIFWQEIICQYGAVAEVITDNGPKVNEAFKHLQDQYGISHVKILPYNSKANRVVERGHFIICEAIIKSCEGNINKWPDKVMICETTGISPFVAMHGIDPVLPFDLAEATFIVKGFRLEMFWADLLALRIQQMEKRPEDLAWVAEHVKMSQLKSKECWEQKYSHRFLKQPIMDGELVLMQNSAVEQSHNRKSKPQYLGPFEVIGRTDGGSYVLKELDGTLIQRGVAGFRLLPYKIRSELRIPHPNLREEEYQWDDIPSDLDSSDDKQSDIKV